MSSLDAVFLAVENATNPMNIGSVGVFEGPCPSKDELLDILAPRIQEESRCLQKVRTPSRFFGRPVWVTAGHMDPAEHIHVLSLADRTGDRFDDVIAELIASPLDRSRPLWEVWIVDGLDDDQWALVAKAHHCLIDGIAGNDLLSSMLQHEPLPQPLRHIPGAASTEPSTGDLLAFTARQLAATCRYRSRRALRLLAHPRRTWTRARSIAIGAKRLWFRQSHPASSLLGPIGPSRRWRGFRVPFETVKTIQSSLGGTVNDVVVAAAAYGFRELLIQRGEDPDRRHITAMIPVSLHLPSDRDTRGNRVANVHARLPVDVPDARMILQHIHLQMEDLKHSHEVDATSVLMHIGDFVPRVVADRIARTIFRRQRNVETVITNVPGPREPLFLGDRQMVDGYPVAPIGGLVRITVAIWSYRDHLSVGITADRHSVPDLDVLARSFLLGFEHLRIAAVE